MKKLVTLLMALAMGLSLCACGGNGNSAQSAENKNNIDVKGTFVLNPTDNLDLSEEGLESVQQYLLVVFDVKSPSDSNEELSTFANSIELTMNETNTYNQLFASDGTSLKAFRENCGYAVSTSYGTLWGGSESVRMCAAFAINGNDIKEDCTAELDFHLSSNIKATVQLTANDIQEISLFDGIFAVEEDADAYQLSHSIIARAQICKTALETASLAEKNGNTNLRNVELALCGSIFSEETVWGISCDGRTLSDALPRFSLETIQTAMPEIADNIEVIRSNIQIMIEEVDKDTPDYDAVNTAQRAAYNTLTAMTDE